MNAKILNLFFSIENITMPELTKSPLNLVWIDCEMTGLDFEKDKLLEVAVVVTDPTLEITAEGPSLVIHQPQKVLDAMGDWCQVQHRKSNLYAEVQGSSVTLAQAEEKILEFLTQYCLPRYALLAGSSVWTDRIFLMKSMPRVIDFLHYRMVDVSAVKEMVYRWYGFVTDKSAKKDLHRALPDIYESINELKLYRDKFFIPRVPPTT